MKINYKPEDELSAGFSLLEPGLCNFTVKQIYSTDKDGNQLKSSKGDEMNKIMLQAEDVNGTQSMLTVYITANTPWAANNLLKAVGRKELYTDDIDFTAIKGLSGKCKVKTSEHRDGFNARTEIASFVPHPMYAETDDKKNTIVNQDTLPNDSLDGLPF